MVIKQEFNNYLEGSNYKEYKYSNLKLFFIHIE